MNFKELLEEILIEQEKSFKDLEKAKIITRNSFYQYKDYTPQLAQIIKIANYLEISLDYLTHRSPNNHFKMYSNEQKHFYANLINALNKRNLSQYKISKEMPLGRANFTYWKQGRLPQLNTLVAIANYLDCSIDELLELK